MSIYHLAISLMLAVDLISNIQCGRYFRQTRSHGCGSHPVWNIVSDLIKDPMFANKPASEVYKILDKILSEDIGLKDEVMEILKLYDDCMRQDGMKFKKDFRRDLLDELSSILER